MTEGGLNARLARRARGADARVVPVREGAAPPKARRAAIAGFAGKAGETCELVTRKRRLLLVGCGHGRLSELEAAGAFAAARLKNARKVALDARGLAPEAACAIATGFRLRAWRDDRWRTKPEEDAPPARLRLVVDDPDAARAAWERTQAPIEGALFTRALVAEPSNSLTPAGFLARLDALRRAGVEVEVLERGQLEREGLGALLAVGGASANAPCLAVLRWTGTLAQPPVAFVGKGITFDTGGVCVKPAPGMWEMRADMAGAAACAGAMLALALRRSPAPAVAVLPLAENALGAASYRPGDVLRAVDGTTVEVVDTDAEGRLVLADALAWTVATVRPQAVVDLATLTGSIVVALGHERAGLFGEAALSAHVAAAGEAVGERVWPMPIGERHREDLESSIADLRQCVPGRGQPDACQAAAFLRAFVGEIPWAHLDIAGVESREEASDRFAKGATGFGVRLLDQLVAARFEDPNRG